MTKIMENYASAKKSLVETILEKTGLNLKDLENRKLLKITHEIVELAKKTLITNHHPKMIDYCEWLPNLAKHGPLPQDCKWHIAQVYAHLSQEDKLYIANQVKKIKEKEY